MNPMANVAAPQQPAPYAPASQPVTASTGRDVETDLSRKIEDLSNSQPQAQLPTFDVPSPVKQDLSMKFAPDTEMVKSQFLGGLKNQLEQPAPQTQDTTPETSAIPTASAAEATDADKIHNFASIIKSKYPEYSDMEDGDLVNKILFKYPEYNDYFKTPEAPKAETPTVSEEPLLESLKLKSSESFAPEELAKDVGKFFLNVPADSAQVVQGLATSVFHPIDTVTSMLKA